MKLMGQQLLSQGVGWTAYNLLSQLPVRYAYYNFTERRSVTNSKLASATHMHDSGMQATVVG